MRLISFKHNGQEKAGVRKGNFVIPVSDIDASFPNTLIELLALDVLADLEVKANAFDAAGFPIDDIEHLPVIPRPGKVICIGRNYAAHASESGAAVLEYPEIFYRGATSLLAHNAAIIRPECSSMLDYEGEFAFVVGKLCRHATAENALDFVAGYTLFNDATIRNYQRFSSQWTIGKNFDGTGAFGPELVTANELPEGLKGRSLTTRLNGELMQTGQIDDLVFPVKKLVQLLSECLTLEPGDVVVTGTPSGVGYVRKPPVWMQPGDTVEVEVEGLGKLTNTVQDEVKQITT
jgi:2-keto-4-pentenoate hydratase/2-oxohepta-3-ene-1,7-dioic acid hydratase in catechol pathway